QAERGRAGLGVDADLQVRFVEQRHRDLERRARGAQAPGPDAPQRRDVADAVVIAVLAEPVLGLPRSAGVRVAWRSQSASCPAEPGVERATSWSSSGSTSSGRRANADRSASTARTTRPKSGF